MQTKFFIFALVICATQAQISSNRLLYDLSSPSNGQQQQQQQQQQMQQPQQRIQQLLLPNRPGKYQETLPYRNVYTQPRLYDNINNNINRNGISRNTIIRPEFGIIPTSLRRNPLNNPLVQEANSQYQYQLNSQYEERTRPNLQSIYNNNNNLPSSELQYNENGQYQLQGNSQRRSETNTLLSPSLSGYDQNEGYTEDGKEELTPQYTTYQYRRFYY